MDCVVAKQDSASDTLVLEFGFREPVGQAFSEEHRSQLKSQIAAFRGILNQLDESPSYRAGIRVLTIRLLCLEGATNQEKVVNAFSTLPQASPFATLCFSLQVRVIRGPCALRHRVFA